jgi:hypothetical protein
MRARRSVPGPAKRPYPGALDAAVWRVPMVWTIVAMVRDVGLSGRVDQRANGS